ncbi:MAG TPA: ATP synthase subunit I [Terriglobales bacterium]
MVPNESPSPDSPSEKFYGAALRRIRRFILILGGLGLLVCALRFGRVVAAGFLVGAIISYVNHVWLERMIEALGERITSGQSRERGGIIVVRAALRYAFIALGAYVIFRVSLAGLYGFLGGLCLTIAAIACEAAVEVCVGLRRGF